MDKSPPVTLIVTLLLLLTCQHTSGLAQRKFYKYYHIPIVHKELPPTTKVVDFIMSENPDVPATKAKKIVKAVKKASRKYNIKSEVLVGLMHVESTFSSKSVSKKGSVGVMQIHAPTWMKRSDDGTDLRTAGICDTTSDLFNEDTNILAGAYILRHYLDRAEKLKVKNPYKYALTKYYGGNINTHYKKTMNSVNKLLKFTKGGKNA